MKPVDRLSRGLNRFGAAACAVLMLFHGIAAAEARIQNHTKGINVTNGLIDINIDRAPAIEVLKEISSKAGVRIVVFSPASETEVTMSVKNRPLSSIIRALLVGSNYAIIYNVPSSESGIYLMSTMAEQSAGESSQVDQNHQKAARSGKLNNLHNQVSNSAFTKGEKTYTAKQQQNDNGNSYSFQPATSPSSASNPLGISLEIPEGAVSSESDSSNNNVTASSNAGKQNDLSAEATQKSVNSFSNIDRLKYQINELKRQIESGQAAKFQAEWSASKDPKFVFNHQRHLASLEERLRKLEN